MQTKVGPSSRHLRVSGTPSTWFVRHRRHRCHHRPHHPPRRPLQYFDTCASPSHAARVASNPCDARDNYEYIWPVQEVAKLMTHEGWSTYGCSQWLVGNDTSDIQRTCVAPACQHLVVIVACSLLRSSNQRQSHPQKTARLNKGSFLGRRPMLNRTHISH